MRRKINEALGVPVNIIPSAIKLYEDVYKFLSSLSDIQSDDEYNTILSGDYTISDMKLTTIELGITLHKVQGSGFRVLNFAQGLNVLVNDQFQMEVLVEETETIIKIRFIVPEQFEDKELLDYYQQNKNRFISIIAHELKHTYDAFKKNKTNLPAEVDYRTSSSKSFGNVVPLNRFLFISYYIHHIENLVRPTQMATEIHLQKITPKQFYNFFVENEIFKILKEAKEFSLENLKESLKNYMPQIYEVLKKVGHSANTEEEAIDLILELFYVNLAHWKQQQMVGLIYPRGRSNPLFKHMVNDDKDKYIITYAGKIQKYANDYERFYIDEAKFMKNTATKMIKKLGRLYELTHQNQNTMTENKSIWDWEMYQKIYGKKSPIVTKLKTKDELISELSKRIKKKL
jgi:hypothetical protein